MSLRVVVTSAARRDMRRLAPDVEARIVAAVRRYADERYGDVKKLAGIRPPEYRLRVGDYRVRFARDETAGALVVLAVVHRREAY